MSMESAIKSAFDGCMNPPAPYEPTEDDINLLIKLHEISEGGRSAEVKKDKKGMWIVYNVIKKKV